MKDKNSIVVKDWLDFQRVLFENSWNEGLKRYRSPFAFRGLSDKDYELKSSLIRLGGDNAEIEKHLLRNFRKYAPKNTLSSDLMWDWMAIAQHHGLATRLLDWTYSPYVAAHFVTANPLYYDRDGVIWCVNFVKSNELLPQVLRDLLSEEGSNVFTGEMLARVCKSLSDFEKLKQDKDFIAFLEPPSFDDRIVNQFALFSFTADPKSVLNEWLEAHPELYFKIIIPAELKDEIRDKLDQVNLTERVLFPGLDGLSAWLKRYYKTRN